MTYANKIVFLRINLSYPSLVFAVCHDGAEGHGGAQEREGEEMRVYFPEASSADIDRSDGIDEIVHGVDISCGVRPRRHRTDRGEESAEEHEEDDEEPHDEDRLLHITTEIRDGQSERGDEKRQEHRQEINPSDRSDGREPEKSCNFAACLKTS